MTEVLERRDAVDAGLRPDPWIRLARSGGVAMVVFSAGLQVLAGELIPPVLAVGVLFGTLVVFLRPGRKRLGLVTAGLAMTALSANAPFIVEDLSHLNGGWVFVLTLVSVLGGLSLIAAGLAVFFEWSPGGAFPLALAMASILFVGAIASMSVSLAEESEPVAAGDVEVVARAVSFAPGDISVTAGSAAVWVDNRDGIRHTFTIDELGVDLEVPANTSRRIDFEVVPGEYLVTCEVPGHDGMTATLVVEG